MNLGYVEYTMHICKYWIHISNYINVPMSIFRKFPCVTRLWTHVYVHIIHCPCSSASWHFCWRWLSLGGTCHLCHMQLWINYLLFSYATVINYIFNRISFKKCGLCLGCVKEVSDSETNFFVANTSMMCLKHVRDMLAT